MPISLQLVDTHCHIHEAIREARLGTETRKKYEKAGWPLPEDMIERAEAAGVDRLICVGTTPEDSELAVEFARGRERVWASVGIHPHEASVYVGPEAESFQRPTRVVPALQPSGSSQPLGLVSDKLERFAALAGKPKVVAIGECGLDFYYNHSPREDQEKVLRFQLELAIKHDLPVIFHVREAFNEFWPIFDDYKGLRGVIHSFSATPKELDQILARDLYVGLNGIMTFTKDPKQLEAAKQVPLGRLVLETDAPFLTPLPERGKLCEPKHVRVTAEFLADLRAEPLDRLAARTTENAQKLFAID